MKTIPDEERRNLTAGYERLTSLEAVLADAEFSPPEKLDLLKGWDAHHEAAPLTGYGRVADAADLGFPDPAPYSPEVQRAMVELYRKNRVTLLDPVGKTE